MTRVFLVSNDRAAFRGRLALVDALRAAGYDVEAVLPPGAALAGLRTHDWDLGRRSLGPLGELRALRALTALYRRERPDLVHHFTIKPVVYGGLAAQRVGIPAVHTLSGLGYAFIPGARRAGLRLVVSALLRRSLGSARHAMFQNADDLRLFIARGLVDPAKASVVAGSGIDTGRFVPLPEPDGVPVVAFIGRWLKDKGVVEFLEAARLLREQGVAVRMRLVGGPDPGNPASLGEDDVQAMARAGLVDLRPWADDVRMELAQANAVCLPSYREGVPRVLLEAAASARAVVATDVPGNREAVVHGTTGLLAPPRDAAGLASAIGVLAADAGLRRSYGLAGRRHVEALFSHERVVGQTLAVYRAALP